MVERMMAVLYNGRNIAGHIKVERIGVSFRVYIDLLDADSMAKCLVIRLNNEDITCVDMEEGKMEYPIYIKSEYLSSIEAIIVGISQHCVLYKGSSDGGIMLDDLMDYYLSSHKVNVENKYTYTKVMDDEDILDVEKVSCLEEEVTASNDDIDKAQESTPQDIGEATKEMVDNMDNDKIYSMQEPFYKSIKAQLDDLFTRYEREKVLEETIDHSRFSRVYYDETHYYVVGEISDEDGIPSIICYGYKGEGGEHPPKEVEASYEWLPLDRKEPKGQGYYMMYQNAITGEVISN